MVSYAKCQSYIAVNQIPAIVDLIKTKSVCNKKMKKLLISVAVVAMLAFTGCSKTRVCNCTITQTIEDLEFDETETMVSNTTQTIEKGHCEDLNATTTNSVAGYMNMTQVVKCEEQK